MFETKDFYNQKGEKFIEYPEQFPCGITNLIAVKNGIFISDCGNNRFSDYEERGMKFFDHQNKKVYQICPSFLSQGQSAVSLKNLGNNRFILIFSDNGNSLKVMVIIQN